MNPNIPTTSGLSYSYNIPKEYKSTSTTSVSTYKNLSQYDACKGGTIVNPVPVSTIPQLFYNYKPHTFRVNTLNSSGKKFSYTNSDFINPMGHEKDGCFGNSQNHDKTVYRTIYQSPYNWGGLSNEKYPKGFNDISSFY